MPTASETLACFVLTDCTMIRLLDTVDRLHTGLDYHLARQNLLVSNLAHVDTPGFRPVDLERGGSFSTQMHVAMSATDSAHLGAPAPGNEAFRVVS
ncbi:MAG: hypothetical protein WCJ30_22275, partial [Deltaproteobacteria bacterium]